MIESQAPQPGEFLRYETEDGRAGVECRFAEDTLRLSKAMMAELFQTSPQNITLHLKALYSEWEIAPEAACKPSAHTPDGFDSSFRFMTSLLDQ